MVIEVEKKLNGIIEIIKMVVYVLLIVGIFWLLFFQLFWILLGLMKDMLLIGDFFFVNKMSYGYFYVFCLFVCILCFGIDIDVCDICGIFDGDNKCFFGFELECGDFVVFCYLVNGIDYIKCFVGLSGDIVQMKNGVLFINGVVVGLKVGGVFEEIYDV